MLYKARMKMNLLIYLNKIKILNIIKLIRFFQNNSKYNFYISKKNVLNNLDIKKDLFKILDQ